jgi:type I restriction enzyme M protein
MSNERKTENIVRSHFANYSKTCLIEEQKSDFPKIDKLLKFASKKGGGAGYPEFIISFEDNPEFLIVIECKGSVSRHESKEHDKYSEYAVDGALLYASCLSKEFDVLAIAVSGEKNSELKVSHFLNLKGDRLPAVQVFSNKLLNEESYIDGYLNSDEKKRQDYFSLLDFTKELNETLHSKKVKESHRSLLISGVLIALENKAFRGSYKLHKNPYELANNLVDTIINELKSANISEKKIENLKIAYSFIRSQPALSGEKTVLSDIITSIDININNYLKTNKYSDVLGQFYIEFLRYANNDKGLGIVLTPIHITQLFSELADVNKDDIIYDNCTGTGGYLISAMQRMINGANGDKEKEKLIKSKQLHGVEYQDDIFALACSNMFIHQDGKNNIVYGNCFDSIIIEQMKKESPTVGFLNPPYPKLDGDKLELEFVLNNLEVLAPNAVCISIIPISCVLTSKGKDFQLKEKILENHTLEAVLSMPEQLFHNSKVAVVTVVMIITAHKPHPKGKKTWFGYFRNDGFVVQKHRGRDDFFNNWKEIREKWIWAYRNREVIDGLSIIKEVKAKDEWCAEAYMETDYSKLSEKDFIQGLKKHLAYSIITSE